MKFEFNKTTADYLIEQAGFTDEEVTIFLLKRRGFSIVQIALELHTSTSTIDRRISSIKRKIDSVIPLPKNQLNN